MDYEQAKARKAELEQRHSEASAALPSYGGKLTPDAVKATPEWQALKRAYDQAFSELRTFNQWYVKKFKREIRKERRGVPDSSDG